MSFAQSAIRQVAHQFAACRCLHHFFRRASRVTSFSSTASASSFFRRVLWEGIKSDEPHFSDREVLLYNTLDYPSYGLSVEKVKMAFRMAYSILAYSTPNPPPIPVQTLPPIPMQTRPPIPVNSGHPFRSKVGHPFQYKPATRAGRLRMPVQAVGLRPRSLRMDSPLSSIRCAPLTSLSSIASATVGLPPAR